MRNLHNLRQSNLNGIKSPIGVPMRRDMGLLVTFLFFASPVFAQELAKFSVKTTDERIDASVLVSLDAKTAEMCWNSFSANPVVIINQYKRK